MKKSNLKKIVSFLSFDASFILVFMNISFSAPLDDQTLQAYSSFQRGYYLTAFNLAKPLSENGNPIAANIVADLYTLNARGPIDFRKSVEYYQMAAKQNSAYAAYHLSMHLKTGNGIEKNITLSKNYLKKAAESGIASAQCWYGKLLLQNSKSNAFNEALPWLLKGAAQGNSECALEVSHILREQAAQNSKNLYYAQSFLILAANSRDETANLELGTLFSSSRDEKKLSMAYRAFRIAAYHHYSRAQIKLAQFYEFGVGVAKNTIEAAAWYLIARSLGEYDNHLEQKIKTLNSSEQKKVNLTIQKIYTKM